jgi:hypothetical protein
VEHGKGGGVSVDRWTLNAASLEYNPVNPIKWIEIYRRNFNEEGNESLG